MLEYSLKDLGQKLRQKEFSSHELTRTYLDRIQKHNPSLNCFITVLEESALKAAHEADEKLQKNTDISALTGIPIAHKDIFCTEGIKTSCASRMLDNFISPYNATVIEKFIAAGAITLGKTNMDEFAMGSSNENSFYGPVKNPWDLTRVPGGSSGGSASAVAGRLAPAATGTDTGGSIRQPAGFCGISGIKPTYGRVSRFGMIAFASSLDQGGPMARNVEDLAILLEIMAGFDERDSTSIDHPVPHYSQHLEKSIQGVRIGIPKSFLSGELDAQIADKILETARIFESQGAVIQDIELPNCHHSVPVYYTVAPAECSSNLARFDGVRYGYRCEAPKNLTDLYMRSRGEGFGSEVKRRIMMGTYALSAGYYDAYYLKAQKIRRLIRDDFQNALQSVDVILSPTTPTTPFKLGEKVSDPVSMYLSDLYTIPANLAGLPALAFPIGFVQGLPVGAQLIGNLFREDLLLNAGHQFQIVTDYHKHCPNIGAPL